MSYGLHYSLATITEELPAYSQYFLDMELGFTPLKLIKQKKLNVFLDNIFCIL